MVFDVRAFLLGFVTAIVMYLIWKMSTSRTSYYEPPEFSEGMTSEQAQAIHDAEFKKLTDEHNKNMENIKTVEEGDKLVLAYRDSVAKLGAKMAIFESKRAMAAGEKMMTPSQGGSAPAQAPEMAAPAPEMAQAPAPTMTAPAVSMYEPEPYY